jgi:hypothetical protein
MKVKKILHVKEEYKEYILEVDQLFLNIDPSSYMGYYLVDNAPSDIFIGKRDSFYPDKRDSFNPLDNTILRIYMQRQEEPSH